MLIIGHRGAPSLAPENTLASFDAAVKAGCRMIELDVQLAQDRLLVIHDEALKRTTNGRGHISEHDLKYLRSLDAGMGQRIPFLEEVIEQTPPSVTVQVELKGEGTAQPTAAVLRRYPERAFLISSFRLEELEAIRSHTDRPIALLFDKLPVGWEKLLSRLSPVLALHLRWNRITPETVERAHALGLRVAAWTVDDEAQLRRLQSLGVDSAFSNCPERWLGLPGFN